MTKIGIGVLTTQPQCSGYLRKIVANLDTFGHITTLGSIRIDIYHDECCALVAGSGPCDCDPRITIGSAREGAVVKLDARGFVVEKDAP